MRRPVRVHGVERGVQRAAFLQLLHRVAGRLDPVVSAIVAIALVNEYSQ